MADQKIKDDQLTQADLLAFGILPPEPDNPKLVKSHEPEPLDKAGRSLKP